MAFGGGATPQASNQNSITQYANWFNDLNKKQGSVLSGLAGEIPNINNQVLAGGVAPQGGVWNGGATPQIPVPRAPVANAYSGMPTPSAGYTPPMPQGGAGGVNSGMLTGGLNNLPTGGL